MATTVIERGSNITNSCLDMKKESEKNFLIFFFSFVLQAPWETETTPARRKTVNEKDGI